MLICVSRNQKKLSVFVAYVSYCLISSGNSFHKYDSTNWFYGNIHAQNNCLRQCIVKCGLNKEERKNQRTLGKNHQTVFGTQLIRVPPGGQQPAPQPAPLPCSRSCLPPGSQQLGAPGHQQTAPLTALLPGGSSCLPPGGQRSAFPPPLIPPPSPHQPV